MQRSHAHLKFRELPKQFRHGAEQVQAQERGSLSRAMGSHWQRRQDLRWLPTFGSTTRPSLPEGVHEAAPGRPTASTRARPAPTTRSARKEAWPPAGVSK